MMIDRDKQPKIIGNNIYRNLPKEELEILRQIKTEIEGLGLTCHVALVGGCVRDILLGETPRDYDIAVVFPDDKYMTEIALPRIMPSGIWKPLITAGRTPVVMMCGREVCFVGDVKSDIMRRDVSINSVYCFMYENNLPEDYYYLEMPKEALEDFEKGQIRIHGDVEATLRQDPIRILRVLRLSAQLGFSIEYETHYELHRLRNLLEDGWNGRWYNPERMYTELKKAFTNGHAYEFVKLLDEYELLQFVFPAVHALKGVDGAHYHNETVFTHCLSALKALDPVNLPFQTKLAALYHDVGKVEHELSPEGKIRFVGHDKRGARLAKRDCIKLHLPNYVIHYVECMVANHMTLIGGKKSLTKLLLRLKVNKNQESRALVPLKEFVWQKYADSKGNMKAKTDFMHFWKMYRDCLKMINPKHVPSVKDLVINGNDIMQELNITPGKKIGIILSILWENVVNEELENNYDVLINKAKEIYNGL